MRSEASLAGIVVMVAVLLLGFHLTTTSQEFSRDNPGWNGTSEFFSFPDRHLTTDLTDLSALSGKMNVTLLLISPAGVYQDTDIADIQRFVEAGNTLILASDDDIGDQILRKMDSPVSIHPGVLASIDRAYNDSYIVVTKPRIEHPITRNVSSLVLDHGSTVTGGTSLIESSIMSWIDTDGNHRMSEGESFGKHSVAAVWPLGMGEVIVISDPSIFINAMIHVGDQWGNRKFIYNCISLHNSLFIEQIESRMRVQGFFSKALYLIRSEEIVQISIVTLILLFIAFFMHKEGRGEDDPRCISGTESAADQSLDPD